MNIYGGSSLGVASPVSKVSAEPASSSGMSGVAYTSGSTNTAPTKESDTTPKKEDNGFYLPSFDDNGTPHWKEQKVEPENTVDIALPRFDDNGTPHWEEHKVPTSVDIALPGFDDNGTPHWEEHKVSTEGAEPVQERHLDVGKLLEGQTEGYRLYSDGEGGFTQDPNSKGGIYFGENALSPKTKKHTATAALPEVSQIYNLDGDDYSFDADAFAAAQMGTGNNKVANSIVSGGGGGVSKDSSVDNHNDAIFGGERQRATPGKSLLPERILF